MIQVLVVVWSNNQSLIDGKHPIFALLRRERGTAGRWGEMWRKSLLSGIDVRQSWVKEQRFFLLENQFYWADNQINQSIHVLVIVWVEQADKSIVWQRSAKNFDQIFIMNVFASDVRLSKQSLHLLFVQPLSPPTQNVSQVFHMYFSYKWTGNQNKLINRLIDRLLSMAFLQSISSSPVRLMSCALNAFNTSSGSFSLFECVCMTSKKSAKDNFPPSKREKKENPFKINTKPTEIRSKFARLFDWNTISVLPVWETFAMIAFWIKKSNSYSINWFQIRNHNFSHERKFRLTGDESIGMCVQEETIAKLVDFIFRKVASLFLKKGKTINWKQLLKN